MNAANRSNRMWRATKQQLKFKGMGCCGSSWNFKVSHVSMGEEGEEDEAQVQIQAQVPDQVSFVFRNGDDPLMSDRDQGPPVRHMSLAMALEFDRRLLKVGPERHYTPLKRLLEETDGPDHATLKRYHGSGVDGLCCVCMERNKDAAFIPCGHTNCRSCSRELRLNRGSCPLCNRQIDDILNIY